MSTAATDLPRTSGERDSIPLRFVTAASLFDGHDEAALQTAREQWKALTGAGCAAKYWSEASGRWEMKAESAATV